MDVSVIGTGHVGLPTAAALARLGHTVVGFDSDHEKIDLLARGAVPFFEPGLEELVVEGITNRRLRFTESAPDAIGTAEIVFICVGTPPRTTGDANLLAVEQAAQAVAMHATRDLIVVEKSTVPAGTAERIGETLARHNGHVRFLVVSNPEFLREGCAVEDSLRPSRILVGSESRDAVAAMRALYAPLIERGTPFIQTDLRTAELAKHASNAFLALKISFANAMARLCEAAGADVTDVVAAMGADDRIGKGYLDAGLGYGGYCFPKDLAAFERLSNRLGYEFPLLREVERINDEAVATAFRKIEDELWNLEGKRVALLGLAYKPGTDDVRFAPALSLARRLIEAGAIVVGFDPRAGHCAKEELPVLELSEDPYAAVTGAHCAVVCTAWEEFRHLDLARIRESMVFPLLFDGPNLFDPEEVQRSGLTYISSGRQVIRAAAPRTKELF